jgi:hypothetical protein
VPIIGIVPIRPFPLWREEGVSMQIRVLGLVALGVLVCGLAVQADEPAKPGAETACCLKAKAKASGPGEAAKSGCCDPKSACCDAKPKAGNCGKAKAATCGKYPKAGGCCEAKAKVAKAEPKAATK